MRSRRGLSQNLLPLGRHCYMAAERLGTPSMIGLPHRRHCYLAPSLVDAEQVQGEVDDRAASSQALLQSSLQSLPYPLP